MPRDAEPWREILSSPVWQASDTTRLVFITLMCAADRTGYFRGNVMMLSKIARVEPQYCNTALIWLEHEAKAIQLVSEGWQVLSMKPGPTDARRDYMREYMAKRRAAGLPEPAPIKPKRKERKKAEPKEPKSKDNLPTTPEAIFVAALFSRKLTTEWSPNEIRVFKEAMRRNVFTSENQLLLTAYYKRERAKGEQGIYRRDLATFLNNIDGELDRARSTCSGVLNNGKSSTHTSVAPTSAGNAGTSNAGQSGKY